MAKVRITVPSRLEETLINTLWELGIIHLIEIETDLPSGSPPEHYTELQRLESEIGELIRLLHPKEIKHERQLPLNELIPNASNEIESLKQVLIISAEEKKLEEEEKSPEYRQSQARIERYKREIGKEEKELDRISSAHYSKLVNLREMLGIEIGRESGYQFIKKTESTSIVQGWIPARRKDELRRKLRKETSGTCTLDTIRTEELPPTYFRGSGIVKSFDYLVNMYSTPRSDEINPAWFLVLSFPIAYGLMVSDVGYGALSLLLSILVTKRTNPKGLYYNLANIWMLSSIFTILFGIFNNQYFGIPLDQYIFPFFHGFDWSHNILTVVMASIIIGIFQISVGLLLGMVNSYNHRDTRSMLFKFFLLLALISGTVLISGLFGIFGGTVVYDSAVILTASVLSMIISRPRSSGRLLDLVTYPLSYVRIMGFGIVSLVVASLIDSAFTPSLSSGVAIFVLYVIVFVLLHLLNMALSTFEAGFQSFRLSFIEFFDEFYTGRGRKYKPFGYERVHTLE